MQRCMKCQKIRCSELEQDVFEAERSSSNTKWISAPVKRQNETRNRSRDLPNAFPPRETDQNFRKTPSRGGKWGKFSKKRLPAAGNGKNSPKNGFPRRESDKISRKTVSCGGKAVKFAGDRFPAAGKGANSPKNAFRRAKSIFKKPPSPPREAPPARFPANRFFCAPNHLPIIYVTNEDSNRWNGLRRSCHRNLFC